MGRQAQSTVILLIMGTAIVFAAVIALAASNVRNRQQQQTSINEGPIVTVNGQPITLRTNPGLAVRIVRPEPEVVVEQPVVVENPTPEPPTSEPQPTAEQTQAEVVPTFTPVPQPQPTQAPAAVVTSAEPVIFSNYTVQQGDTLYRITTQLATSIALMAEYGIAQDSLVPNTTISVPVGNPAFCPGRRPYAVGEGESIFRISQLYNTTKEDLQAINGLDANFSIDAGQIICVP